MITPEQKANIEARFKARLEAHGVEVNPRSLNSKKALRLQSEFFAGAMAAIQALLETPETADKLIAPPAWVIAMMASRPIISA